MHTVPIGYITLGHLKLTSTTQSPCSNWSVLDGAHKSFKIYHSCILILKEIICLMVSQIPFRKDILSFKCLLTPNNFFELFRLRPSLRESKQSEFKSNRAHFPAIPYAPLRAESLVSALCLWVLQNTGLGFSARSNFLLQSLTARRATLTPLQYDAVIFST